MQWYLHSQDQFAWVLTEVAADQWGNPTPCTQWTVRDIAGHVVWGLDLLRTWCGGTDFENRVGAPGAARPGDYLGTDPIAEWERARAASARTLTPDSLAVVVPTRTRGPMRVGDLMAALTVDFLTHAWDLGQAIGVRVRLDPAAIEYAQWWADTHIDAVRSPAMFGPALAAPAQADPQTRLLRYLGRSA
ncbi:TIGR03086 family protein [Nocardia terpenica]|uniref:TIGR03086 family metal-binding protein n=1 Tax=Nocardia terpenica TaxID=455432 RepID=UPI002FE2E178